MECTLYKVRYVGKAKTRFNMHLNNHRSDVSDPSTMPTCCYFTQNNHQFNNHTKFTLIETIASRQTNRSDPGHSEEM